MASRWFRSDPVAARPRPPAPGAPAPDLSLSVALAAAGDRTRRRLLIVAPDRRQFYELMKAQYAGREDIEVILDRRQDVRRIRRAVLPLERRKGGERRRHPEVDALIDSTGWAIVPVEPAS